MIRFNSVGVGEKSTEDFPVILVVRRGGDRSLGGGDELLAMMPLCPHEGEGLYLVGNRVPSGHFSCIRIQESSSLALKEVKKVILLLDGLCCGWSGGKVEPSAIVLG